MSIHRDEEIACPRCGKTQTVKLWESIDAEPDPAARAALFEAQINRFDCAACDFDSLVPVPLLYHDRRRQFVVQYFPFGLLDEKEFVDRFSADGRDLQVQEQFESALKAKKIPPGAEPLQPHLVFEMAELVRYVLFRERVFDAWSAKRAKGAEGAEEDEEQEPDQDGPPSPS